MAAALLGSACVPAPPWEGGAELESLVSARIAGADNELGQGVLGLPDLNGDGHDDLAVVADDHLGVGDGVIYVFAGPLAEEQDTDDAAALVYGAAGSGLGTSMAGAGDLDGDGLQDLVVGSYDDDRATGEAVLLHGPLRDEIYAVDAALVVTAHEQDVGAGQIVAGPGDMLGDGVGEIAVSASGSALAGEEGGAVYLFDGARSGALDLNDAEVLVTGATGAGAGSTLAAAGDLDGDGLEDLYIGGDGGGWVLAAPPVGTSALADVAEVLQGEAGEDDGLATPMGDRDGDGYDDLAISFRLGAGSADVYLLDGPVTSMALSAASAVLDGCGGLASATGDGTGDGVADLAVLFVRTTTWGESTVVGRVSGDQVGTLSCDEALDLWEVPLTLYGASLSGAADLDDDGQGDLLLGGGDAVWLVRAAAL